MAAPVTWSVSRDSILHSCERRYYFEYLSNARSNSRDAALREIALLKQLKTIPMWMGESFHFGVASWARRARHAGTMEEPQFLDLLYDEMSRQWDQSNAAKGRDLPSSKIDCRLFEHEYDLELPKDALISAIRQVQQWAKCFLAWASQTDLAGTVRKAGDCWIDPPVFGPQAPGFVVGNAKVIVKVDLALLGRDGVFEIWDWKTGAPPQHNPRHIDPHALQVNVYQLWPHIGLRLPLERIRAHLLYVSAEPVEHITHEIDPDVREYVLSIFRRSLDRMLHLSRSHGERKLDLEDFDYAIHPGLCRNCSFKRICLRSLGEEIQ